MNDANPDAGLFVLMKDFSERVLAPSADAYEVATGAMGALHSLLITSLGATGETSDAGRAYIIWAEITDLLDSPWGPESEEVCERHARAFASDWMQVDTAIARSVDSFFDRWKPYSGSSWNAVGGTIIIFRLDGKRFSGLTDFYRHIGQVINGPGGYFGNNLDSLADCLSAGFGLPDPTSQRFRIIWVNADVSRVRLGYPETVHELRGMLKRSGPQDAPAIRERLRRALERQGPTAFDWIVDIFESSGVPFRLV